MRVKVFIPCFVDQLYPQVAWDMVSVLERVGCQVFYNEKQTCCGQPAFNAGFVNESKEVCKKFVDDFSGDEIIVAPSGSCVGFLRSNLKKFFSQSTLKQEAEVIENNVFEFSEFLVEVLKKENVNAIFNAKVSYHDACGALRECGIKSAPRKLLKNVQGLELIEHEEAERCCGFGGTFAVKYESISSAMAQTKIRNVLETKADYLISTDVSCLMHLEAFAKKSGLPIQCLHLASVLAKQ